MNRTHGLSDRPEWQVWYGMIRRCTSAGAGRRDWVWYGGKGIRVCPQWLSSFEAFYRDMGPRPGPGWWIDRIDGAGDYCPENCRWADVKTQQRNRSSTKLKEDDVRQIRCLLALGIAQRDVAKVFGVHFSHISNIKTRRKWAEVSA